ncbi:hypothetical protein UA08_06275 [Talaromyces atroroseus]|uniref:Calcium-transporting ATPase n=1 Tax=Talaromyces atroroseus TaxID=1441469 RepID=A0A225AJV8_TALAT|nr:hypothetical protein UA08_06275 [Talaromyces atroroseus]OKL58574.1 hypothetical protein UA08_06275 [Talaromyces atroroseus]
MLNFQLQGFIPSTSPVYTAGNKCIVTSRYPANSSVRLLRHNNGTGQPARLQKGGDFPFTLVTILTEFSSLLNAKLDVASIGLFSQYSVSVSVSVWVVVVVVVVVVADGMETSTVKDTGVVLPETQPRQQQDGQFGCSLEQLQQLAESRDLKALRTSFGGLAGLEASLLTDRNTGLSPDESLLSPASSSRRQQFGDNRLPMKREPPFWQLMWMAYNDYVLFLLTGAAIVSLALGLYQAFGIPHTADSPGVEWVEGVAILVAIIIIVLVSALNDFQKQHQFRRLNKKQQDRNVKVVRAGRPQEISIHDVVVGDVVQIEPGDVIPADGIMIQGLLLRCDESSMTGESDLRPKYPANEACSKAAIPTAHGDDKEAPAMDPFIISGTRVAEGMGSFLVIATGRNSVYGRILVTLEDEPAPTPLQVKLAGLAKNIAICGGVVALIFFVILFIKFLAELPHSTRSAAEKGQLFLNIFIIALTVVVIAVPEGLPLAVTLSLAFATTRMLRDRNLVRSLRACETMGNATSICSDKTGTLTQNKMTVIASSVGINSRSAEGSSSSLTEYIRNLSPAVKSILKQSIVVNSTAFEADDSSFVGSRTESALLTLAREALGMGPVEVERSNARVEYLVPFDSSRKCMISVVHLENDKYRAYVKGASEILLRSCTRALDSPETGVSPIPHSDDAMSNVQEIISKYAARSLRTITLAYRDFDTWPPSNGIDISGDVDIAVDRILQNLTFLAVMGIQDPLRDGVPDAIQMCAKAGVTVRMVTGDNLLTAKSIASEAGIITDSKDIAMDAAEFRTLEKPRQIELIPHLKVLARSTPDDKRILVKRLKEMGEIVAVTGDGTNDAAALTAADVGFSMGISGTEVAREASSIVLLDDNFASIVKAIMWGRAVNDAVRKFLQFQITITITSVGLTFVSAVANGNEQSVLTAVQLMWINLFQDTMAALALATDPPSARILDRKPMPQSASLITTPMWKMIIGQSIYQMAVTLVLYFAGSSIFHYRTAHEKAQLETAIFNTYVWLQIFNMYNNRQLENTVNVAEGVLQNWLFITISAIMVGAQILIAFVGGQPFSVVRMTGAQWAYSLVLGFLSIPLGFLIRQVPDRPIEWVMRVLSDASRRWPMRRARRV